MLAACTAVAQELSNITPNCSRQDCLQFLDHSERYGKKIKTSLDHPLESARIHSGRNTITYEARYLKALLLKLYLE
jgi:hypothetical protein